MKKFECVLFLIAICWMGNLKANSPAVQTPEADLTAFVARMSSLIEELAVKAKIPADSISTAVSLALNVDIHGKIIRWHYCDNKGAGADFTDLKPASQTTRQLIEEAYEQISNESAFTAVDTAALAYTSRIKIRMPKEKIALALDVTPLLFLGEKPDKTFAKWMESRLHDEGYQLGNEDKATVHIRFYIEPDGRITPGEVLHAADERVARNIFRVIRTGRGFWTPRQIRGVPQRTAYEYRGCVTKNP